MRNLLEMFVRKKPLKRMGAKAIRGIKYGNGSDYRPEMTSVASALLLRIFCTLFCAGLRVNSEQRFPMMDSASSVGR